MIIGAGIKPTLKPYYRWKKIVVVVVVMVVVVVVVVWTCETLCNLSDLCDYSCVVSIESSSQGAGGVQRIGAQPSKGGKALPAWPRRDPW
jgi:hypothetical protein